MNILVTGSAGQLGNVMQWLGAENSSHNYVFTDIIDLHDGGSILANYTYAKLDITDIDAICKIMDEHSIDLIVNCAAYTNVDKAEDEKELAYLINATAVSNLAFEAKTHNAKMIHISTDYVFDGKYYKPYAENRATSPLNVYGLTKYQGEEYVNSILGNDGLIIRTSWLYSNFGKNFVKTMVNLGKTKYEINVIFDQIGTPTYANDLGEAIFAIINSEKWVGGTFHFSNEGVCSWYDFAKEIMDVYELDCKVYPVHSYEYESKAERPFYSVLDKTKIKDIYNVKIPHWKDSLRQCQYYDMYHEKQKRN